MRNECGFNERFGGICTPEHPTQNLILNFARFHTTVVGTFGHIESTIV
jgi:hypothetical protein